MGRDLVKPVFTKCIYFAEVCLLFPLNFGRLSKAENKVTEWEKGTVCVINSNAHLGQLREPCSLQHRWKHSLQKPELWSQGGITREHEDRNGRTMPCKLVLESQGEEKRNPHLGFIQHHVRVFRPKLPLGNKTRYARIENGWSETTLIACETADNYLQYLHTVCMNFGKK